MSEFYITFDCDCGNIIKTLSADLSNEIPEVPFDFAAQSTFECEKCGKEWVTGDFEAIDSEDL